MILDLVREDCFSSVDKEEWGLARWLGGGGADGPQYGLELVVLAPAASLRLLLEGPSLEAPQDHCVSMFGLAIAPGVGHRSVANLFSKVSTVGFKEVPSKLRVVICDDAVGDPEAAHEALDELDGRASWDGTDGFHFRPLGELVDGDIEVSVAPSRPRERSQDVQPPDHKRPRERYRLEADGSAWRETGMLHKSAPSL